MKNNTTSCSEVSQWDQAVNEALSAVVTNVNREGDGTWRFNLTKSGAIRGCARTSDTWLVIDADARDSARRIVFSAKHGWDILMRQRYLQSAIKAVTGSNGSAWLRMETPVADDPQLADTVAGACEGFVQGYRKVFRLSGWQKRAGQQPAQQLQTAMPIGAESKLRADCIENGWKTSDRKAGFAVQLDVSAGFYQAVVRGVPGGGVEVQADLLARKELAEASRQALGLFLIKVNGGVRMVRAAAEDSGNEVTIRLEGRLGGRSEKLLPHLLAAMSAGCSICAREVEMLQSDIAAREFLANVSRGKQKYNKTTGG